MYQSMCYDASTFVTLTCYGPKRLKCTFLSKVGLTSVEISTKYEVT